MSSPHMFFLSVKVLFKTHVGVLCLGPGSKFRKPLLMWLSLLKHLFLLRAYYDVIRFSLYHMTRHNQLEVNKYMRKIDSPLRYTGVPHSVGVGHSKIHNTMHLISDPYISFYNLYVYIKKNNETQAPHIFLCWGTMNLNLLALLP